jgi:hypothetical protein
MSRTAPKEIIAAAGHGELASTRTKVRRVFAARKTKNCLASARRHVRKAKISTTALKTFTATAKCTSGIGRSLPQPDPQNNGDKARSPSKLAAAYRTRTTWYVAVLEFTPAVATSKLATCSVEGLFGPIWPAARLCMQHLLPAPDPFEYQPKQSQDLQPEASGESY